MPKANQHIINQRRDKVLELYREGLTYRQIADRLGDSVGGQKWHWRTVENDVRAMKVQLTEDAPDLFQKLQEFAEKGMSDLEWLRTEAKKLYDTVETPRLKHVFMEIIKEVAKILIDKALPSQAVIRSVGEQKVEVEWASEDPNIPLCTKCGRKHFDYIPCDNVADRDSLQASPSPANLP